MTQQPIIANPIGWVQLKLVGGWRAQLGFLAGYCGIALLLHLIVYEAVARAGRVSIPQFAGGAFVVMTLALASLFLLGGTATIKKAIQRDYTTAMIGSHRTSAVTGYAVVLGYLTGATVQILLASAANWLICTILALMAGVTVSPFAPSALLAVLVCWAAMFWPLAVLVGFDTQGKMPVGGLVVSLVVLSSIGILDVWPGLSLLFCSGNAPSLTRKTPVNLADASVIISMLGQILFGLIFFAAAARRFARDDVQGFTPALAAAVLALTALLSGVGLAYWPQSSPSSPLAGNEIMQPRNQLVATLAGVCAVAFLPVAVAAGNAARWARRRTKDHGYDAPKPRSFVEAPVMAALIVIAIWTVVLNRDVDMLLGGARGAAALWRLILVVVPFLAALLTVRGLLRYVYAYTNKGYVILIIYVLLVWVAPVLTDAALEVALDRAADEPASAAFACSPVGMWLAALKEVNAPLIPGLVLQTVLAIAALIFARRARY